jgi:hypothetical protein
MVDQVPVREELMDDRRWYVFPSIMTCLGTIALIGPWPAQTGAIAMVLCSWCAPFMFQPTRRPIRLGATVVFATTVVVATALLISHYI